MINNALMGGYKFYALYKTINEFLFILYGI